jgi:hypothetical protein
MFERYTEKARRCIFFARYEANQYGSPSIEPEHLLLGLLREDKLLSARFVPGSAESIRKAIEALSTAHEATSASLDLPLSTPCKRVLAHATEEAERFAHRHIGTEHLLLGILREPACLATQVLTEHGLQIESVREAIAQQSHESDADVPATRPSAVAFKRVTPNPAPPPSPRIQAAKTHLLRSIRIWLAVVIVGLFLSGVTAFPLETELALTVRIAAHLHLANHAPALNAWFLRVYSALADTNARYPFLTYGTDWLAFAHLVIAVAFIGPYLDPVRNKWFITWGFIACGGVPLLALIAGPVRGIPFYWRLIDSSFGVVCCLCLLIIRRQTIQLEQIQQTC